MKKGIKGIGLDFRNFGLVLIVSIFNTACNNDKDISLNQPVDAVGAAMNPTEEVSSDSEWVLKAYNIGLEEVGLSEYVKQQLSSPAAKKLADGIINDHNIINGKMKDISSKKGISLPDGSLKSDSYEFMKEHSQNGPAFDKAYVDHVIDEHNKEVDLYNAIAEKASDKDIRDFFSSQVAEIKHHLYLASAVRDSIISKEVHQK